MKEHECANCGVEIDLDEDFHCMNDEGLYFCCQECLNEYTDDNIINEDNDDDVGEEYERETVIVWNEKTVQDWLQYNENITTDGMEFILNECCMYEDQYPEHRIIIKEDDYDVGIIIEIWEEDRKVKSETYLYDDIN